MRLTASTDDQIMGYSRNRFADLCVGQQATKDLVGPILKVNSPEAHHQPLAASRDFRESAIVSTRFK